MAPSIASHSEGASVSRHKAPATRQSAAILRPRGWDAVSVLTIGLVLTCAVPSYLTIPALGPAGKPGTLWFLGALLWWIWSRLQRPFPVNTGRHPVRLMFFIVLGVVLVSYSLSNFVGIPIREVGLADGGVLKALSWAGVLLIANDGISNRERLQILLRRTALVGGLMATLGLVQFWSGQSLVSAIYIPGLMADANFDNVQTRSGFTRAAATASHPLEYGTVLSMSLPIAVALALNDSQRGRIARWFPVAAISAAALLSISRSALIGVITGAAILAISWSKRARITALVLAVAALGFTYIFVPGMVGTIRGLFIGLGEDTSAASRTSSYAVALEMAGRSFYIGRGFGTFLPEYRILDNQYLGLLIEIGIFGLLAFLGMIAAGLLCSQLAKRRLTDPVLGNLSHAVLASLSAGAVTFAFFDALTFPMAAVFMFLLLGIAGAFWRISHQSATTSLGVRTLQ